MNATQLCFFVSFHSSSGVLFAWRMQNCGLFLAGFGIFWRTFYKPLYYSAGVYLDEYKVCRDLKIHQGLGTLDC